MNILLVDENPETLNLLNSRLVEWGYSVYTALDGSEALSTVMSSHIDIIMAEWGSQDQNGVELCRLVRESGIKRFMFFILMSELDSKEDIIHGLESGVDDYIIKPINFDELRIRLEIASRMVRLERELTKKYEDATRNYFQTIDMIAQFLEVYDEELGSHCKRVGELALKIARLHPEIPEEDYKIVESAGILHDIGMVGIPVYVRTKRKTERTGDEAELYRSHPVQGEIILNEIELLKPIAKIVRTHHEQYNGRGFPDGLSGKEISPHTMVVSAASMYDNLIHRGKCSMEDIPEKLFMLRGYQLDPFVVDLLMKINEENIHIENKKNFKEINIDELENGMILAKSVRLKTGALLLPSNTKIDGHCIEKLNRFLKLDCISGSIYILK